MPRRRLTSPASFSHTCRRARFRLCGVAGRGARPRGRVVGRVSPCHSAPSRRASRRCQCEHAWGCGVADAAEPASRTRRIGPMCSGWREWRRCGDCCGGKGMPKFNYGGQAVIEGVMMRGRHSAAVAVRAPSGGVLVHEERLNPRIYARGASQWPFVRGLLLLWDMLILGTRMMMFAANVSIQREADAADAGDTVDTTAGRAPDGARVAAGADATGGMDATGGAGTLVAAAAAAPEPGAISDVSPAQVEGIGGAGLAFTLIFSLAFAIGLFFLLPLGAVELAGRWVGSGLGALVVEGVVRLVILILYLAAIGRLASVQRVFEYHGAEHKAINAYEAGEPLDVAHVRAASRVHTRCGTGFLLIVVVLSIFVFALLGHPPAPVLILSRIVLVPVIASLAYELLRLGAA